ncbi:MAG: DUF1800 domain-containing protein, partial [Pseudomonadota bacterium]
LPSSKAATIAVFESLQKLRAAKKAAKQDGTKKVMREMRGHLRIYANEVVARSRHAMQTESSFHERLVRFWSNHFTVSGTKQLLMGLVGPFEREAIRPHVLGTFRDMLQAVEHHPGMLIYLDNIGSIGPNSRVGKRRGRGLNENLAREILELHTLGVDGGYTQSDIEELARAITGWTVGNKRLGRERMGESLFASMMHEPGARTVLGRRYSEGGEKQGRAILDDLARHPSTARHIATKFARHFIADLPPASAVSTLERVFLQTYGNLAEMAGTVVSMQETWASAGSKFKTPEELIISSTRALGTPLDDPKALRSTYAALGQTPFRAPSPAGWSDMAEDWAGADAIRKRLEWANQLAGKFQNLDARAFLQTALGRLASNDTNIAISQAESGRQAFILALMSPQFQRR